MSASNISMDETGEGTAPSFLRTLTWTSDTATGGPTKVSFDDIYLRPAWYRLVVWTSDEDSVVTARARFLAGRRADLRIRMEPLGKKRFAKIFKIAEPLSSISITLTGEQASRHLSRVEVHRLNKLSITWFLATKATRYVMSNRGRINWKISWSHLLAALHPRGNFAFRTRYDRPGGGTYDKWRTIYEYQDFGVSTANALKAIIGPNRPRVGVLVGDHLSASDIMGSVTSSLMGTAIDIFRVTQEDLCDGSGPDADFILPVDYEGQFRAGAIERLLVELSENPDLSAVFADNDFITPDGIRQNPRLKPPWDRELLWCGDYIRAPLLIRWTADLHDGLELSGACRKPAYALALTLIARCPREALHSIPAILFHQTDLKEADPKHDHQILADHLAKSAYRADLKLLEDGTSQVNWKIPIPEPRVSIIIPSKNNHTTLKACIDSILARTKYITYEIVIADNGSDQKDTVDYLLSISNLSNIKIIRLPGPFNFSKINNDARKNASGDVLIFLNDDTKVIIDNWLIELVSLATRPDVGAVGALLLYPNGSVQHGGVLLGVGGPADHAFRYLDGKSAGYLNLLRCRREVTAVTGACLAVSAAHFDSVGGFDEMLMVTCNDVDLCLRLRAVGLVNIWTPWARLEHWESMSRGVDFTDEALERQASELRIMSERWGPLMDRDPTYHPGLSDFEPNYSLSI